MTAKNTTTAKTAATTEAEKIEATVPGQVSEDKAASNGKTSPTVDADTSNDKQDSDATDQVEGEKDNDSNGKTSLVEKAKGLFDQHKKKFVIGAVAAVVLGVLASRVHLAPVEDENEDEENNEV